MKKFVIPFLLFFTTLGYFACKKDSSGQDSTTSLNAAKTSSIAKGEPVVFSMDNANGPVSWSVSPSTSVLINGNGNKAAILFGRSGHYLVNAASGSLTSSRNVYVTDSTYPGDTTGHGHGGDTTGHGGDTTHGYTIVPLTGDQIHLTVSRFGYDSAGLIFSAVTTNSYNCLNHSLLTGLSKDSLNGYTLSYNGVRIPPAGSCSSGQTTASSFAYAIPIADGTYSFHVLLNGTLYTGSFVKSGITYTFTWPYSSGVTLSPLVLN